MNKNRENISRIPLGRGQPSIRDYLVCLGKNRHQQSSINDRTNEIEIHTVDYNFSGLPGQEKSTGINTEQTVKKGKVTIDIGLTAEDLLALPSTPPVVVIPNCHQQSATISSSFCSDESKQTSRSSSNFSSEIADVLAYVRGRPSSTLHPSATDDEDLTDFDQWLSAADSGELSDDENNVDEDEESSFNWPTDDRVLMNRKNGRNTSAGSYGKPFEREAENRRIDKLLTESSGNSKFNVKF